MNESSSRGTLTFTIYQELGFNKTAFFSIVLIIYMVSVIVNISLMLLLYLEPSLHKPMYTFLFCLMLNGLIGSTAVWPHVIFLLFADLNTTSYKGCVTQFFVLGSYGVLNYTTLTVMAYDRLVSIFKPLQYSIIMTPHKVKQLLIVANCIPVTLLFVQMSLISQIPLCKYTVQRLFCDYFALTDLLCDDTIYGKISNVYSLFGSIIFVSLPIILILFSYMKIIKLILKCSRSAKMKVFETCSPHVMVFVNFSFASLFSVTYNRGSLGVPREVHIFLSVIYALIPPLLHPIIYGVKNKEIRYNFVKVWKRRVWCS